MQLCKKLPPHSCWVEAFCGSAALTFAKEPAPIEVINDINDNIINVFKQLRENHDDLVNKIRLTPYSRKELELARIINSDDNDIERARKFLIQSMMAINGIFGKERGGFSYSESYSRSNKEARVNRWYNLPVRLEKVVERLRSVRIENIDAIKLIKKYINRPATLIYLDPPYLGDRTQGYTNDLNDINYHNKLLELVNNAKCMIFISGYTHELYNLQLNKNNGWTKKTLNTSIKNSKGMQFNRTEVIWMNKWYNQALETNRIPIELTEKEIKYNKINPERH